jgi:hypothetical protein
LEPKRDIGSNRAVFTVGSKIITRFLCSNSRISADNDWVWGLVPYRLTRVASKNGNSGLVWLSLDGHTLVDELSL